MSEPRVPRTQLLSEHATFSFLLVSLYHKVYKRHLRVEHSLGDGMFYLDTSGEPITDEIIQKLDKELREILASDVKIEQVPIKRTALLKMFQDLGLQDKVQALTAWQDSIIPCIRCGEYVDYAIEPMSTDKARINLFELRRYDVGILARLPTMLSPNKIGEYEDPAALMAMFRENAEWCKRINIDCVGKLNKAIMTNEIMDIKMVAEGLHERKLAKIAEALVADFKQKRVVTIAGPSSSNKTTFAKRLSIQLNVSGYKTVVIEMDDYFQDNCKIPYGPDGLQDLEDISAMNVELLGERVHQLLRGEPIPARKYNFKLGIGEDHPTKRIVLPPDSFLILEGIHGLNPQLLKHIGGENATPIYVSALTSLNVDYNHRFPTSDARLIRRIVRDHQYRGASPRSTIRRWTSVRMGEERNIFPYQKNAKMFFNSSLVYEVPVLSILGRVLLCEAVEPEPDEDPNSEESREITAEVSRILFLLNIFYPLSPEIVPKTSCIREFIGGSEFKY